MRRAVIDLGTNTFNLLVADVMDGKLDFVHHEKLPVMLGMGGINEGFISQDALHRAEDALRSFKSRCVNLHADVIVAIGTSALRGASNSQKLLDFANDQLDINIQIVSGIDEASLIYEGVKLTHNFTHPAMIMDIGGGSTEFIYANNVGPRWSGSYDIGVSRIYQFLGEPDEFGESEFEAIRNYLDDRCGNCFPNYPLEHLVGSSGTFETFYEMIFESPFPDVGEALDLPLNRLNEILHWSKSASLEQRINNPWVVPMRKKMLPIAAVKLLWIMNKWPIKKVWVSPYSLKEGALIRLKAAQ